jgi:hypothetical protein
VDEVDNPVLREKESEHHRNEVTARIGRLGTLGSVRRPSPYNASNMASLETGRRLGPYDIVSPAGAGGMAEGCTAKGDRLDRTVTIQIRLPHLDLAEPAMRVKASQARLKPTGRP